MEGPIKMSQPYRKADESQKRIILLVKNLPTKMIEDWGGKLDKKLIDKKTFRT